MFRPGRIKRIHQQRGKRKSSVSPATTKKDDDDDDGTRPCPAPKRRNAHEQFIHDVVTKKRKKQELVQKRKKRAQMASQRPASPPSAPQRSTGFRTPSFIAGCRKKQDLFRECVRFHRMMCASRRRPAKPLQIVVQGPTGCGKTYFVNQLLAALKKTPRGFLNPVVTVHPCNFLVIDDAQLILSTSAKHVAVIKHLKHSLFPGSASKRRKDHKKKKGLPTPTKKTRGNSFIVFVDNLRMLPASLKFLQKAEKVVYFNAPSNKELMVFAQQHVREHQLKCDWMDMMQAACGCKGDMRQLAFWLEFPVAKNTTDEPPHLFDDTKALMKGQRRADTRREFSNSGALNLAQALLVDTSVGGRAGVQARVLGDRELAIATERFSDAVHFHDDRLVGFKSLPSYHNLARFVRQGASAWGSSEPMPTMWDERKACNAYESKLRFNKTLWLPTKQFTAAAEMVTGMSAREGEGDSRFFNNDALTGGFNAKCHLANRFFHVYDKMSQQQIDFALMHLDMKRSRLIDITQLMETFRTILQVADDPDRPSEPVQVVID
jgi:hypothetical protein